MDTRGSAFAHYGTNTVSLAATSTAGVVALPAAAAAIAAGTSPQMQVYNAGTVAVFVRGGGASTLALVPSGATPGDMPVAPGATVIMAFQSGSPTYMCAITASGTATVYFTPGTGL